MILRKWKEGQEMKKQPVPLEVCHILQRATIDNIVDRVRNILDEALKQGIIFSVGKPELYRREAKGYCGIGFPIAQWDGQWQVLRMKAVEVQIRKSGGAKKISKDINAHRLAEELSKLFPPLVSLSVADVVEKHNQSKKNRGLTYLCCFSYN